MSLEDVMRNSIKKYSETNEENWKDSIPDKVQGYDFDTVVRNPSYDGMDSVNKRFLMGYAKDPDKFLILNGGVGSGKTTLAVSLCEKFIREHTVHSALFVESAQFLEQISFRDFKDPRPMPKYTLPEMLIIDDVGAGSSKLTDTQKKAIWSLINARWGMNKYTIITTNLPNVSSEKHPYEIRSLQEWFGKAAWDRVTSSYQTVEFGGTSMRTNLTLDRPGMSTQERTVLPADAGEEDYHG